LQRHLHLCFQGDLVTSIFDVTVFGFDHWKFKVRPGGQGGPASRIQGNGLGGQGRPASRIQGNGFLHPAPLHFHSLPITDQFQLTSSSSRVQVQQQFIKMYCFIGICWYGNAQEIRASLIRFWNKEVKRVLCCCASSPFQVSMVNA
jgi:hypothetical protein